MKGACSRFLMLVIPMLAVASCAPKSEDIASNRFYLYRSGKADAGEKRDKPEINWTVPQRSAATSVATTGAAETTRAGEYLSVPSGFAGTRPVGQSAGVANSDVVRVGAYTKSDGQVISGHYRTAPNASDRDNFSSRGNVNRFTGKRGTR